MKKSSILILAATMFALVACQGNNNSTSLSSSTLEPSINSLPDSTNSQTSVPNSSGNSSMSQGVATALFKEALKKDYSNSTIFSYQQYDDGESSESDYEYIDDGYIVNYSYDLAFAGYEPEDCTIYYYIDEDGTSFQYYEKEKSIDASKDAWLNKGALNVDLSIWNIYFYLPLLLNNITEDDVTYANGQYYVNDTSKIEELNYSAFGYAFGNDIIDIVFTIDSSTGYLSQILGFCDDSTSDPLNYVQIEIYDVGTTVLPSTFDSITPFSENSKMEYWQHMGWPQDYERVYYTDIDTEVITSNLDSDENHDVIIDVDKTFEVSYTLSPSSFEPWEFINEEDRVIEWHYDETLLEMDQPRNENIKTFRGIGDGETEVYASVTSANGTIESEHIKVKINGLKPQDKTDAVYDFVFSDVMTVQNENTDEMYYDLVANNAADSKSLYTITAGPSVGFNDGANADYDNYFVAGQKYLMLKVFSQSGMNKKRGSDLYFDFGEQQVSKISFNYGLFWEAHGNNIYLDRITEFSITTYNDESDKNTQNIRDEIVNSLSAEFVKNFELEFAPASHVEITVKGNWVGNETDIVLDSICFFANEDCHDYVAPEDIEVESITINPDSANVYVGKQLQLTAIVAPQNAYDKTLTWHVEAGKEDVLSIENGLITGLTPGSAQVWATAVNDVESNYVTVTVENMPDFTDKIGNIYIEEDGDDKVTILDSTTAKFETFSATVEATISTYRNGKFILTNEDGEGFTLEFTNSRVDVTELKYLSNGEIHTSSGTVYCYLSPRLTGFSLSMDSTTVNVDNTYNVQIGDTKYLTVTTQPSDSNVTVTFESNETSKATVEANNAKIGQITFVDSGEVAITVTVQDVYGNVFTKTVRFAVAAKVYPTDSNWEIVKDKADDEIKVGSQVQFSVNWLDDSINTDKTVSWSISSENEDLASITRAGLLTAKEAGEVTVTASVTGENGTISKSVTFTIAANEGNSLPDEIVGVWESYDDNGTYFTFTINADGSAILETESGDSWEFTFDSILSGEYYFTYVDNSNVQVSIFNLSSFYIYDDESAINDFSTFCIFGEYVSIEKI